MHRDTPGPGSGEYSGHGFCGSRQCYLYASLDDFVLQETITFTSDAQAYRLGSLRYLDEYSNTRVIAWDEKMSKINQDNPWVVAPAVPFPCFPPPDREDDDVAYPVTPVPVCPIPIPIPVGLRS
jgi:hypothetical protein